MRVKEFMELYSDSNFHFMPKRIEQANKEYFNQAENLLATGIIPKKRGEKTGK